jgi:hypothetical protein
MEMMKNGFYFCFDAQEEGKTLDDASCWQL